MIEIKNKYIALKGIRTIEFIEAWRNDKGKCLLKVVYRDDKEILIEISDFNEYKELANKIKKEKNYLELYD